VNRLADKKIDSIEQAYRDLLEAIGENPERQGLTKTPARAARALEFLTQGYRQSVAEIVNGAIYDSDRCPQVVRYLAGAGTKKHLFHMFVRPPYD